MSFEFVTVHAHGPHVLEVRMDRPEKRNAMNPKMWKEMGACFAAIADEPACRAVLLTGAGKHFTAGIDLMGGGLGSVVGDSDGADVARRGLQILREGGKWQDAWSELERCGKPVIACVHGGCWGAGLELIAAADIRFCSADAFFQAPEVDIGLAADIGGNQRLPKIVGNESLVRELMLSGRRMGAAEAKEFGLVSRVCADRDDLLRQAGELAAVIASKSPVATYGVKTLLNYTRDHTVDESLRFALTWNAAMLQTTDVQQAGQAFFTKQPAVFENLIPLRGDAKQPLKVTSKL